MSIPSRPYFYGYARTGKTVHAYTMFVTAALACAVLAVGAVFKSPAMLRGCLFFGLIFGLGVHQSYFNLTAKWKGRKLRKLSGLPKPWFSASDEQAYEWFKAHPAPQIPLTPEYFPESVTLLPHTDATRRTA